MYQYHGYCLSRSLGRPPYERPRFVRARSRRRLGALALSRLCLIVGFEIGLWRPATNIMFLGKPKVWAERESA